MVEIAPGAIELRGRQALNKAIIEFIFLLGMAFLLCWLAVLVFKLDVVVPSM